MSDRAVYVIDKESGTVRQAMNGAVSFLPADEYEKLLSYLQTTWREAAFVAETRGVSAVDMAIALLEGLRSCNEYGRSVDASVFVPPKYLER